MRDWQRKDAVQTIKAINARVIFIEQMLTKFRRFNKPLVNDINHSLSHISDDLAILKELVK